MQAGNRTIEDMGCPFIIVLGHPHLYARFGFRRAGAHNIRCEWDAPDDVFMLLTLDEQKMRDVSGLARYRDEFSTVT